MHVDPSSRHGGILHWSEDVHTRYECPSAADSQRETSYVTVYSGRILGTVYSTVGISRVHARRLVDR